MIDIDLDNLVRYFREKSHSDQSLINAVHLDDNSVFETDALTKLAQEGQLMSYKYNGFWRCMDTLLEKRQLEAMLESGDAPWIKW